MKRSSPSTAASPSPIGVRAPVPGLLLAALLLAGALAGCGGEAGEVAPPPVDPAPDLETDEVQAIVDAALATLDREAVVAVTDRRGVPLALVANFDLDPTACREPVAADAALVAPDAPCAVLDRALQVARTASFFSADQTPLSSRAVRFLSGVHFPPGIRNTGAAALFGIENTNRGCKFDAAFAAGADYVAGQELPPARSLASVLRERAGEAALPCESSADPASRVGCTTGPATLPGGVPIYRNFRMVGGVGVAVRDVETPPDPLAASDGATILRRDASDPAHAVAERAARAFAGDRVGIPELAPLGLPDLCENPAVTAPACCGAPEPCSLGVLPLPPGSGIDPVIFVDGIELPFVAKRPGSLPGSSLPARTVVLAPDATAADPVPDGWLVEPRDATDAPAGAAALSAAEVRSIIDAGVVKALEIRGAIRLPLRARTAMVLAVSDTGGDLIGLFRMTDATVFSVDVAVAKSRNVAYFSRPDLDPADTRDAPGLGLDLGEAFPPGTAISNRTLGFGAQPFWPSGIDGSTPGPFRRIFVEDTALPCSNGREPANGRQNGIVFFPGSAPIYRDGVVVGGFGVSGDGVEQDDIVSAAGLELGGDFATPDALRSDQLEVRGVRLPYLKFNRRPEQ